MWINAAAQRESRPTAVGPGPHLVLNPFAIGGLQLPGPKCHC